MKEKREGKKKETEKRKREKKKKEIGVLHNNLPWNILTGGESTESGHTD